jgi:uroporphyrinogen-III decarboxylase
MDRSYYINLANSGLKMPIGTDLVLHDRPNPEEIKLDGQLLGQVVEEAARRYHTPLAIPQMNLELEKVALLKLLGVPRSQAPTYHFSECPPKDALLTVENCSEHQFTPELRAHIGAIKYVSSKSDLLPMGMSIGPFSLMTKLLKDPITPVYLAGSGVTAEEDEDVHTLEAVLELSTAMIMRSLKAQVEAGAKAVAIAEPAANIVYLSPKQIEQGADIFDRYVINHNRRIKEFLDSHGVDLFFHCCGELTNHMVARFASLEPVILSLGSSRKLWQDASIVPKHIVLFGNLPTKQFYSDDLITVEQVVEKACELIQKMREVNHPFILGSECDVLSVPGAHDTIKRKVQAFVECKCC